MVADRAANNRYIDLGLQFRRLSVATALPGQRLTAVDGTEVYAGERSDTGDYPVAIKLEAHNAAAALAHLRDGDELYTDEGEAVRLQAETLLSVGGVWDKLARTYRTGPDGQRLPAASPVVLDLVEPQVVFLRRFVQWLDDYKAGRQRIRSLLGFGARRGGKSVITLLCAVAFLLEIPRIAGRAAVGWVVSVSLPEAGEIKDYIEALLPEAWLYYRDKPYHAWSLANGTSLINKTTKHDAEATKAGKVDVVMFNEAAKQKFSGYKNALRGTTDSGGIILLASNSPTMAVGEWITDVILQIDARKKAGKRQISEYITLDPKLNAAIDQQAVSDIDEIIGGIRPDEVDEGLVQFVNQRAYSPPFAEAIHVVPAPTIGLPDITRDITQAVVGRAYDYIAGADFQYTPHNVTIIFKIFGTVEAPILWAVDEIYTPQSTEDEHIDEVEAEGYRSGNVLVVGDCSGETQDGRHSGSITSFEVYERRGWRIVSANKKVDPRGRAAKNPNIEKSLGRVHHALNADRGNGLRAMMVDPCCQRLIGDLVKCKLHKGKPCGAAAHGGDAWRYPQWWLTIYADCYSAAASGPSPYASRARRGRR